jgi:hypothetical protein
MTREVINHHVSIIPDNEPPRNVAEIRDSLRQFSRRQHFIVPVQTQQNRAQRLSPKNKGVSPYIPLQASNRGNKI